MYKTTKKLTQTLQPFTSDLRNNKDYGCVVLTHRLCGHIIELYRIIFGIVAFFSDTLSESIYYGGLNHMDKKLLNEYAKLMVKVGANVQPGQKVRLYAEVDQHELATLVAKECYAAKAAYVEMFWSCGNIERLHYENASVETLGTVLPWEEERQKQMVKDLPVRIFIESADPDELSGIPADIISTVGQMRSKVLKKYRDEIDGKHQWLIVAAASPKWALKVFPDCDADTAVEKLWDAILSCVYIDGKNNAEEVWAKHTADMKKRADWLNSQQFTKLRYKSSNGTDFSVELIPGAKWCSAADTNRINGACYVPNMPTEEVFISPMKGRCEGTLIATKPLSWSGQLIDGFSVEFKNGKVYSCHAKQGEEMLKKMFAMDEGASMLGEVALVPKDSPINKSGLLFMNTLFDENACCHIAVGEGFLEVIDGFENKTLDEIHAMGINDSIIHVDFMIGSDDLDITGIRTDGTEVPVFHNGTWA